LENRDRLLARVFARLADTLAEDFDVLEFLLGLCGDAVQVVGAEAAGVMLADSRGGLRLLASSEERMRDLELFELQSRQGPCLDAFRTGDTVTATTAEGERLWPLFAPQAADRGFRYMCAVPMQLRGATIGALNLFRATDDPFAETDLAVAQAMAKIATTGLLRRRSLAETSLIGEQLQDALHSRIAIEQAKGVLAEYLDISVDDAFQRLRSHAQNTHWKLTDAARDVATNRSRSSFFNTSVPPPR
jgi:GAF domain-containing protein